MSPRSPLPRESLESIPSLDGRIYGGDGRVLAEDVERDNLRVHYRWLEDPPDPRWLLQQALSKLTRAERRNRARVEAEKQAVLARRDAMWQRLAEVAGVSPATLAARRATIQKRSRADRTNRRRPAKRGRTRQRSHPRNVRSAIRSSADRTTVGHPRRRLTTPPRREEARTDRRSRGAGLSPRRG